MKLIQQYLLLFFCIVSAYACNSSEDIVPSPSPGDGTVAANAPIQVMSYNILQDDFGRPAGQSWTERKESVLSLIRSYKTDLLCAQEDYLNQGEDISRALGFYKTGVARFDGSTTGRGEFVAIYYNKHRFTQKGWGRFWMSETPDKPSPSWDGTPIRICNWVLLLDNNSGQEFYVFNTHINLNGSLKSAELIKEKIQAIAGDKPVILAGDMNTTPTTPAIKVFESILQDSRSISQKQPQGPIGTYNGMNPNRVMSANYRYDYVFVSKHMRVLEYEVSDVRHQHAFPSDHFPVWVKFEFK
ncbi:endonuclease/exonuclease/phosphatase family protein [Pontibacter sp. 13R65]|uniref:endonuclease/exonuclease/phosphatase family protein n=1 Tax=Pontibacter sp. 13R65 TaxID=3127458 RepID=UPI00301C6DB9